MHNLFGFSFNEEEYRILSFVFLFIIIISIALAFYFFDKYYWRPNNDEEDEYEYCEHKWETMSKETDNMIITQMDGNKRKERWTTIQLKCEKCGIWDEQILKKDGH